MDGRTAEGFMADLKQKVAKGEIILYYEMVNTISNDALKWY